MKKPKRNSKVGLAQVAEAAGVSKMTASRVLNNGKGFSEETRERVMREVERLNYFQNRLAAAFSADSGSTFVGVSIPELGNEVFSQILEGIERKLTSVGYQTILGVSQHNTANLEEWAETVLSWRPAGLIITGRNHSSKAIKMLKSGGVPIVELWDLNTSPLDMCVGLSHFDSGYEMGRFMIEKGIRRIGCIGTYHDVANAAQSRRDGFMKAVQDGGGPEPRAHVLRDTPGFYSGFYATEQFLARTPDIEALYYQNDNMAAGGLMYCQSKGFRIPQDIRIAGWGDLPIGSILEKRLTTTHVPHLKMGQLAAENLLASISGDPVPDVTNISYRLVPGATV